MERQILDLVKLSNPSNPLQYVHNIVKDLSIEKLNNQILQCRDCESCNGPKSLTKGISNATVMIIGESVSEDQKNSDIVYPFENEGGEILDIVLEHYDINKEELFYINSVNCWPNKKVGSEYISRTPTKKEVDNCKVFLEYAIKVVQPRVIITLGGVALNSLFDEKLAITLERGVWKEYNGIVLMPTFHPAYFNKIKGKKDPELIEMQKMDFMNDIGKAFLYLEENYPDNNVNNSRINLI